VNCNYKLLESSESSYQSRLQVYSHITQTSDNVITETFYFTILENSGLITGPLKSVVTNNKIDYRHYKKNQTLDG
jgi:hypothetical protein